MLNVKSEELREIGCRIITAANSNKLLEIALSNKWSNYIEALRNITSATYPLTKKQQDLVERASKITYQHLHEFPNKRSDLIINVNKNDLSLLRSNKLSDCGLPTGDSSESSELQNKASPNLREPCFNANDELVISYEVLPHFFSSLNHVKHSQLMLLGEYPMRKNWAQRIIGKVISKRDFELLSRSKDVCLNNRKLKKFLDNVPKFLEVYDKELLKQGL